MANNQIQQFNFYHRYFWNEIDFQNWVNALLQTLGGCFEGAFNRAVLQGFGFSGATGLSVGVDAGYAVSASGYFMTISGAAPVKTVTVPAPTGTNTVRHLVVARPKLTPTNYIQSPTQAGKQVPLNTIYATDVVLLPGTQGPSADYPFAATGPNDVVLFGVSLDPGAASVSTPQIDMSVRDSLGKNSAFQQNQGLNDSRCKPYRLDGHTVGIKPSQLFGDNPYGFLYVNKITASSYPQNGGAFSQLDSFYNFQTGAVSGGDGLTAAFTPTIPSAGNYVVARLSLSVGNTISVTYGTPGTKAQCLTAIINQIQSGAGGIAVKQDEYPIAYVILGSQDDANISSLDVIDARATFTFGGPTAASSYPNVFLDSTGGGSATTFAAALALLPASGGVILVTQPISVTTKVTIPSNVKIMGRDRNAAVTFAGSGQFDIQGSQVVLSELAMQGTAGMTVPMVTVEVGADSLSVERCTFVNPSGAACTGIDLSANAAQLNNNVFSGVLPPSSGYGIIFEVGSGPDNASQNNLFTG